MHWVLPWCLMLLAGAHAFANDDVQYVKSVKGARAGGFQYNPGANIIRLGQNTTGYGMRYNMTASVDYDIGVCYIEVPTASLVRDPAHVPAGNGSRPDLSRIRSCCKGYIRNIHNFRICDPVCSKECVNALCTAPEVCTCFPDHVKNLAGFCIPTCPIGCQNGHCSGGECLCKEGYKLDRDSKFCSPSCRGNCGGIGNCTAPNTCECRPGYQSTPDGSCNAVCDRCLNGDCVAPNECRCHQGYSKDQQGQCVPQCPQGCGPNGRCISPNLCNNPSTTSTLPPYLAPGQSPYQNSNQPYYPNPNYPYPNSQQQNPNQYNPNYPNQPGSTYPNQQFPNGPQQIYPNQPLDPNQPGSTNPNQQYPNGPQQIYPNLPSQEYPNQPNYPNPNQPSQHVYYPPRHPLYSANQTSGGALAQCFPECINGICLEGNTCSCNSGYILDRSELNTNRCVPNCPGGCPNGICSAPNFCICNVGYYKDHSVKGRATCIKRIRRSLHSQHSDLREKLIFKIPEY